MSTMYRLMEGRYIALVFNFYTIVIALMKSDKKRKDFSWSTADAWTSAVRFFFLIFIFYQNSTNMLLNSFYGIARLIQFVAAARYNIESQANIFSLVIFTSILKSIKIIFYQNSTNMLLNSFYGIARLIQFVAAARYNIESQANIFSLVIFTSILKSIKITYRFPSTSIFFSHLLYPIQKYKNVYY